jgi:hypothetical protein
VHVGFMSKEEHLGFLHKPVVLVAIDGENEVVLVRDRQQGEHAPVYDGVPFLPEDTELFSLGFRACEGLAQSADDASSPWAEPDGDHAVPSSEPHCLAGTSSHPSLEDREEALPLTSDVREVGPDEGRQAPSARPRVFGDMEFVPAAGHILGPGETPFELREEELDCRDGRLKLRQRRGVNILPRDEQLVPILVERGDLVVVPAPPYEGPAGSSVSVQGWPLDTGGDVWVEAAAALPNMAREHARHPPPHFN